MASPGSAKYGEAPTAVLDGVVSPAWLERACQRQPIFPGMVLQERDRIETGAKARSRREVDIRLATVTAGIRGTDLWGRQGGAKEIVCLLEGRIEFSRDPVAGQTTAPVILDQPLQFYIAPKGEPTLPIGRVPDAQLAQWTTETDIAMNAGGTKVGGRWTVRFDADTTFTGAMALYQDLRNQGYAAQFEPEKKAGKRIYVVQLANLSSEGDARALATRLGQGARVQPSVGR